jgi:hypothetical protein
VSEVEVDDEQTRYPWDRQPGEGNWHQRFLLYRDMPHNTPPVPRTLFGAANLYQSQRGAKKYSGTPPHWIAAYRKWDWQNRSELYDAHLQQERESIAAVERAKVLTSRYALMHKRVQALDALAHKLLAQSANDERLWLPDVKSVGTGPNAKRVDLVQFNEGLVREIRGCLADIAAELGERVKKTETAITQLPGSVYVGILPDDLGCDP